MTTNCRDCIYYQPNLDCCNYFEIMDTMRPCPPGDECTVKVSNGKTPDQFNSESIPRRGGRRKAGETSWDTERAYRLWMEGVPTGHIAEMVAISPGTLSAYATKHGWPRDNRPKPGGNRRKKNDVKEETAGAGAVGTEEETSASYPGAAEDSEEARSEHHHLGSDPGEGASPEPAAPDHRGTAGDRQMNELLEAAIGQKVGAEAYLTGIAVKSLCNWQFVEDLKDARDAIDQLIERLEK